MRVCFIGIGSIAKRHITNLRAIAEEQHFELQIDAVRRPDSVSEVSGLDRIFYALDDLQPGYDAIFITNPTEFHLKTLEQVHDKSKCFFIEKPLTSVQRLQNVNTLSLNENNIYYVACPLRYTSVIQYLKSIVADQRILGVRCISSSYLPEWRPGTDYRTTYSAHKDLGGGVAIDLIHEWDYLQYLFGWPDAVTYLNGKKSDLEMDCEDSALYIAEYPDKFIELHLDYFGRKTIREIMIFTPEDTIVGDLAQSKVSFLKSGKSVDFGEKRDDFQKKELKHFLEIMVNGQSDNSIYDAYRTTLLTQGIVEG